MQAPTPATTAIPTSRPIEPITTHLEAIKAKQRLAWGSGDYSVIGTTLQIVGETLCEAVDLRAGERILDVACGNGNVALAAARRCGEVTALDYVTDLLNDGRRRAAADRLPIDWIEGDAESLPFEDGRFDVVTSCFGVMFTPNQERAAKELARVCKRGGRIALASWTPSSFVGQLFSLLGRYVPPPLGLSPPSQWGTEERLRELFAGSQVMATTRDFVFRYPSAEHFVEVFRCWYGPVKRAFAALGEREQASLEREMLALLAEHNRPGHATLRMPSAYLEAVILV